MGALEELDSGRFFSCPSRASIQGRFGAISGLGQTGWRAWQAGRADGWTGGGGFTGRWTGLKLDTTGFEPTTDQNTFGTLTN